MTIFRRGTLNYWRINRDFWPIYGLCIDHCWTVACRQHFDSEVYVIALMRRLSPGINKGCRTTHKWILFITESLGGTPKTTYGNLVVCTGESEAEITNNKRLHSRYCTVDLTTDRQEASRGLSTFIIVLVVTATVISFTAIKSFASCLLMLVISEFWAFALLKRERERYASVTSSD